MGLPFNALGFPDFTRYEMARVLIELTNRRRKDFKRANAKAGFSKTPTGYTWHHHHNVGWMQLVPTDIHDAVKHTGGVAVKKGKLCK